MERGDSESVLDSLSIVRQVIHLLKNVACFMEAYEYGKLERRMAGGISEIDVPMSLYSVCDI